MSKKKLAIIGVKGLPGFGGGARSTESLLNELKVKYNITVYSVDSHTELKGNYHGVNQITFKSFPSKRLNTISYYSKSLIHCLVKGDYDIVHVQHIYAGFIIPFLRLKYKVVNTIRGIIPSNDNKWNFIDKLFFRTFELLSLQFSDISVSVCQPHIKYLQKIKNRKIHYIPNGVHIHQEIINEKNNEGYLCFSAGRIISLKGCHLFLKALHEIQYKGKIKIIGSLEHVESYEKKIKELAIGLDVDFLGLIKDKKELFKIIANSNIFVFPSLNEGMSNMLLEAASLKVPIIASDIVENKYVFNNKEITFFKSNDASDLGIELNKMIKEYNIYKNKAELAFIKIKNNHNWHNISLQYDILYQDI